MKQKSEARAALRGRIRSNRIVAAALLLAVGLAGFFWFHEGGPRRYTLKMTAGESLAHRHRLAEILRGEALKHDLDIEIVPTGGSQEALAKIASGELDVALALGDFDIPDEHIRQVAVLNTEALHLFVRPQLVDGGLLGLRGCRLSLSSTGSNANKMARRLLGMVGLETGRDYKELDYTHEQLMRLPSDAMPDGIFAINSLPWQEVGEPLVKQHDYLLMELPYGDAASLRNPAVQDTVIPAFSYGINPPVPERPLHTLGQRLLVVAHRSASTHSIERLMEVIFESEFGRRAKLPLLNPSSAEIPREFPYHQGTLKYLNRNEPLIKTDSIDRLENLRSFLVSAALALFLFYRWNRRRNMLGFETYIDAVSEVEMAALAMERSGAMDFAELRRIRGRLSELKNEALEQESEGKLVGEEQMGSFLSHVLDVRNYLDSLLQNAPEPKPTLKSGVEPAGNEQTRDA